jgi:catechol 2,3-dioxygenase-like lactoylglutathione lyase family enzyme
MAPGSSAGVYIPRALAVRRRRRRAASADRVAGAKPNARFAHLAFRTERPADEVLRAVRASGLEVEGDATSRKPAAQIFVRLPGGVGFSSMRHQGKPCTD